MLPALSLGGKSCVAACGVFRMAEQVHVPEALSMMEVTVCLIANTLFGDYVIKEGDTHAGRWDGMQLRQSHPDRHGLTRWRTRKPLMAICRCDPEPTPALRTL